MDIVLPLKFETDEIHEPDICIFHFTRDHIDYRLST